MPSATAFIAFNCIHGQEMELARWRPCVRQKEASYGAFPPSLQRRFSLLASDVRAHTLCLNEM